MTLIAGAKNSSLQLENADQRRSHCLPSSCGRCSAGHDWPRRSATRPPTRRSWRGTANWPKNSMLAGTSPSPSNWLPNPLRGLTSTASARRSVLSVHVISAESTELFVGPPDAPLQLVRVTYTGGAADGPRRGRRSDHADAAVGRCRRRDGRSAGGGCRVRSSASSATARVLAGDAQHAVRVHRRRARLDDVHDQPLPLRPGVVEHPGRLHQRVDRGPARPLPADQRVRPGARPPRDGPPRAGVQVRAGRGRLPQAVLGHPSRGPRRPAPVHRRRPRRGDGRRLQRAQHQPHQPRDDDPKLRARHGFSARHPRRRPGHRVAARRLRPRPAVPGHGGRRRADLQLVGPRPAPPVGPDAERRATPSACSSPASSSGSRRPGAGC